MRDTWLSVARSRGYSETIHETFDVSSCYPRHAQFSAERRMASSHGTDDRFVGGIQSKHAKTEEDKEEEEEEEEDEEAEEEDIP